MRKKLEEWENPEELRKELDDIEDRIRKELDDINKKQLTPSLLTKIRELNKAMELEGV